MIMVFFFHSFFCHPKLCHSERPNAVRESRNPLFSIRWLQALFGAFMFIPFLFSPTLAQTALPPDLKITCGKFFLSTQSVTCSLIVPAETVGTNMDISIPKTKGGSVKTLKKSETLPPSGVFLKIENTDSTDASLMKIDYADLKGKASSSSPYILFSFDLSFPTLKSSELPLLISGVLKKDSELHTPTSLSQNKPFFKASEDIPLSFQITQSEEVPPPNDQPPPGGTPIGGSFTYEGTKKAAPQFCFDDPTESMTISEWAIICEAKSRGIISGNARPDGTYFFPNQPINRAEAVKIVTLGILKSLGKLSAAEFSEEEKTLQKLYPTKKTILYPDIRFEKDGKAPWYAVYVSLATRDEIVAGYPDGKYKPEEKINNAESYRVIVETGRVASKKIGEKLEEAVKKTKRKDWFFKYVETLKTYDVEYSDEYAHFTTRKEFLIMVMELLKAVGL